MTPQVICIKYKIKDCLKGWTYTGVFRLGETSPDNNDTEEEIKKKIHSIILKKSLIFTHTLYLVLTIGSFKPIGVIPYNKQLLKNQGSTYKLDIAGHLGLAHYAVAGTTFVLDALEIGIYDKDNYYVLDA